MATTLISKGQVTIPKHIRDASRLASGASVEFAVNAAGELVIQTVRRSARPNQPPRDRSMRPAAGQMSGGGPRT